MTSICTNIRTVQFTLAGTLILSAMVAAIPPWDTARAVEVEKSAPQLRQAVAQPVSDDVSGAQWTIMTMAPDGSWGVAIDIFTGRAIAKAISDCKEMYRREIGCGYQITAMRAGWSLAYRCGRENIMVAERDLAAARKRAAVREQQLRALYGPDMPACRLVVSVDPRGVIAARETQSSKIEWQP